MAERKKTKPAIDPVKAPPTKRKTLDIINDWTQRGLYIYLRAISSKHENKEEPHIVLWKVWVEYRNGEFFKHHAVSEVTPDKAIAELDELVPKTVVHDDAFLDKHIASTRQASKKKTQPAPQRRKKLANHV